MNDNFQKKMPLQPWNWLPIYSQTIKQTAFIFICIAGQNWLVILNDQYSINLTNNAPRKTMVDIKYGFEYMYI